MYKKYCDYTKKSYNEYLKSYSQHKNVKILRRCLICHKHYKFLSEDGKIFGFVFYSHMHRMHVCAKCGLDDYLFGGKMKITCSEIRMNESIYFNFFKNAGNGNSLVKRTCVFLVGA